MSQLFDSRAKVLEYEARQALIEKEIEFEKLKQQRKPWVGLTEEEKTEIRREHYARTLPLMDAVEAKLREKNQ